MLGAMIEKNRCLLTRLVVISRASRFTNQHRNGVGATMPTSRRPMKAETGAKLAREDAVSLIFENGGVCREVTLVSSPSRFPDGRFPAPWRVVSLGGRWVAVRVT